MHFVTRNATEPPFSGTFHLRPEIAGFDPRSHRRQASGSSVHFQLGSSVAEEQELRLLETPGNHVDEEDAGGHAVGEEILEHDCQMEECKRVVINVSGQRYETQLKTLNRLPSTLLGDPTKRGLYWDPSRQEYFFDRHRPSFQAILYYYQSGGRLKRPMEVPVDIFITEMEFYELGKSVLSTFKQSEGFMLDEQDIVLPDHKLQRRIWETFEHPNSSFVARIMAIASVIFILTSVVVFCIETLPQFHGSDCKVVTELSENGTTIEKLYPNFTDPLFIIESVCILWFVIELVMRTITCPSKIRFVKHVINWIDLASILPYFLFLFMALATKSCSTTSKSGVLSVLRVLRVVRIFKLSKHSEGLRILGKTLQVSLSELMMFVLFLGIGVVIFAGAIFYAELQHEHSFFVSIPDAFWWAVVSMTTVGYGDVYPVGVLGKLIGSMCVLTGLLAIALPVPVIVTNFNNIYKQSTGRGFSL